MKDLEHLDRHFDHKLSNNEQSKFNYHAALLLTSIFSLAYLIYTDALSTFALSTFDCNCILYFVADFHGHGLKN